MRWLLDTNAVSRYLADKDVALTQKIKSKTTREVCICSIVKAELLYGAWNSNRIVEKLAELKQVFEDLSSFDFDDAAAGEFGKLQAYLSQQGCRIGPNDTLIAAIALANDLTLVTHNTREFSRVPNLKIEDWQS